jgi:NADH:ubiquinone oxidoreductase subunit 4 (subunit M)
MITKEKLYKTNTTMWYNKIFREKQLVPNYISIKIKGKKSQCQKTVKATTHYRLGSMLILLASCQQTCMTYTIAVYSKNLLMMDRGTVRNMSSFIPRINLRK